MLQTALADDPQNPTDVSAATARVTATISRRNSPARRSRARCASQAQKDRVHGRTLAQSQRAGGLWGVSAGSRPTFRPRSGGGSRRSPATVASAGSAVSAATTGISLTLSSSVCSRCSGPANTGVICGPYADQAGLEAIGFSGLDLALLDQRNCFGKCPVCKSGAVVRGTPRGQKVSSDNLPQPYEVWWHRPLSPSQSAVRSQRLDPAPEKQTDTAITRLR